MEGASLTLPKDLIEAAINQHVSMAVTKALDGHTMIVQKVVQAVLQEKVGDNGMPDRYDPKRGIPWVEWAMRKAIQDAVQAALSEEVKKHEEAFRTQIAAQMRNSKSPLFKQVVDSLTGGMVKVASDKWRVSVSYGD
jgi:phosphoglycerate-specific signal transduction histidine kinase